MSMTVTDKTINIRRKYTKFSSDTNYEFELARNKILTPAGSDSGMDMLWRKDNGTFISAVSRTYQAVEHKEAHEFVTGLLDTLNIRSESKKVMVGNNGGRFMEWLDLPDMKFGVSHDDESLDAQRIDSYVPSIYLVNSYDKSLPFQIQLGVIRLICSNGMISTTMVKQISLRHTASPDYKKIAEALQIGLEDHIRGFSEKIQELSSTPAEAFVRSFMAKKWSKAYLVELAERSSGIIKPVFEEKQIVNIELTQRISAMALLNMITENSRDAHSLEAQIYGLGKVAEVFGL